MVHIRRDTHKKIERAKYTEVGRARALRKRENARGRERQRDRGTERGESEKCGLESLNLCAKSALRNENGETKN